MQRKTSKQSRAANADERRFCGWTKEQCCIFCGHHAPSIAHHIFGSSKRVLVGVEKVMIGHWAVLPVCEQCHQSLHAARKEFVRQFGREQDLWVVHASKYSITGIPISVVKGITHEGLPRPRTH